MIRSDENVVKHNVVKLEDVEWEFELEVGSNKVTAKGGYRDDYENWMARCPIPGSAHPDITALTLKKISAKRQEGWVIDVKLSYECNDPDANYPGREKGKIKRYHMEPSAGEEPLLTNQLFKDLTDAEQQVIIGLMNSGKQAGDFSYATENTSSEQADKAIAKIRKGIEAYRNPGLIWVERFSTNTLADVELPKILKTVAEPPGNAPSAGSERDWLRLAPTVNPHDDGKTWDIENRWELSLPGKWDPDLYPAASA